MSFCLKLSSAQFVCLNVFAELFRDNNENSRLRDRRQVRLWICPLFKWCCPQFLQKCWASHSQALLCILLSFKVSLPAFFVKESSKPHDFSYYATLEAIIVANIFWWKRRTVSVRTCLRVWHGPWSIPFSGVQPAAFWDLSWIHLLCKMTRLIFPSSRECSQLRLCAYLSIHRILSAPEVTL